MKPPNFFCVEAKHFYAALKANQLCVAPASDARPAIEGVRMEIEGEGKTLSLISSNGAVLLRTECPIEPDGGTPQAEYTLHAVCVKELLRVLKPHAAKRAPWIKLRFDGWKAIVGEAKVELVMQQYTFPMWRQVIPVKGEPMKDCCIGFAPRHLITIGKVFEHMEGVQYHTGETNLDPTTWEGFVDEHRVVEGSLVLSPTRV